VGETSVLIVVASAHRAQAFEACRWLIDTLKKTVPIWKKETFQDGAVWADGEPFPAGMAVAHHETAEASRAVCAWLVAGVNSFIYLLAGGSVLLALSSFACRRRKPLCTWT
jgi:hypothetical protein